MSSRIVFAIAISLVVCDGSKAADFGVESPFPAAQIRSHSVVSGQAAVLDGQTLWFPGNRQLVRLSGIDSCDLVQWSFDPKSTARAAPSLVPVPCGALAKAWLKRTIGGRKVHCDTVEIGHAPVTGQCRAGNRDLALEMLRVGWAKVSSLSPSDSRYIVAQQSAMAARYGMWRTYVLDMPEWRRKAIDKTLGRRPLADINLLGQRDSEISPPFADARRQPERRDR